MRNGSARPPMEIPPAFFAIRRFRFYGIIYIIIIFVLLFNIYIYYNYFCIIIYIYYNYFYIIIYIFLFFSKYF